MEMADAVVINKADGDNVKAAKRARAEYQNALHLFPAEASGWIPEVKTCSALDQTGLPDVWDMIERHRQRLTGNGFFEQNRKEQSVKWMQERIAVLLEKAFYDLPAVKANYPDLVMHVEAGDIPALNAAHQLMNHFLKP